MWSIRHISGRIQLNACSISTICSVGNRSKTPSKIRLMTWFTASIEYVTIRSWLYVMNPTGDMGNSLCWPRPRWQATGMP